MYQCEELSARLQGFYHFMLIIIFMNDCSKVDMLTFKNNVISIYYLVYCIVWDNTCTCIKCRYINLGNQR